MADSPHFIAGRWRDSPGAVFSSANPATGQALWSGPAADEKTVDAAVAAARKAFPAWSELPLEKREERLRAFAAKLEAEPGRLAKAISLDVGKPAWEAAQEVQIMVQKCEHTIRAYRQRCAELGAAGAVARFRPHGVMAILGPFNLPGHLPNGHIMPALLAGNTVVFKPSDKAPLVAEEMTRVWEESGLPPGVLNLVQGGVETATALARHEGVDALFFTGSSRAGLALGEIFARTPGRLLALEMGGNNALVVHDPGDLRAAAVLVVLSAFLTAGQRCNCARRLILTSGVPADELLAEIVRLARALVIGAPFDRPEPFCGPLITVEAAQAFLRKQEELRLAGAIPLLEGRARDAATGFVTPAVWDVSSLGGLPDEETFGPLLNVIRVGGLEEAIRAANATSYGLAAGFISRDAQAYEKFRKAVRAGVVNWNQPVNAASSALPFGGLGLSGNHRPSAYLAVDCCAYPVSSIEASELALPASLPPGLNPN